VEVNRYRAPKNYDDLFEKSGRADTASRRIGLRARQEAGLRGGQVIQQRAGSFESLVDKGGKTMAALTAFAATMGILTTVIEALREVLKAAGS
jgi:hypothetical protein